MAEFGHTPSCPALGDFGSGKHTRLQALEVSRRSLEIVCEGITKSPMNGVVQPIGMIEEGMETPQDRHGAGASYQQGRTRNADFEESQAAGVSGIMHCSLDMHPLTTSLCGSCCCRAWRRWFQGRSAHRPGSSSGDAETRPFQPRSTPICTANRRARRSDRNARVCISPAVEPRPKMLQINWGLILIVTATAAIGVAMLYSAANGSWNPGQRARSHAMRSGWSF